MKRFPVSLALVVLIMVAQAQQPSRPSGSILDLGKTNITALLGAPNEGSVPDPNAWAGLQMARVVDTVYELGPGDVIAIQAVGVLDKGVYVPVTADGKLMVPSCGEIPVGGLTLAAARSLVGDRVSKVFRNAPVSVALVRLRTFRVYLTGDVPVPGYIIATGAMRVSDIFEPSVGLRLLRYRRAIHVISEAGGATCADLALFYNSGDVRGNPFLREGTVVHVPKQGPVIGVYGAVRYSGQYDFLEGDTLGDLLAAAGGLTDAADSSRLSLTRFVGDGPAIDTLSITVPHDLGKRLAAGDRIVAAAKPQFRKALNVIVQGEVNYPGVYPIRKDQSTLSDIINQAGGVTENAFLAGSYIFRTRDSLLTPEFAKDPASFLSIIKSLPIDPGSIRPEEVTYMRAALTENGERMLVDVAAALRAPHGKSDVLLRENDMIVVSRKSANIQVWGAVASPGLVSFEQGRTVEFYIRNAGGFSRHAVRHGVLIRRSGTTSWVAAGSGQVNPGDAILVPEDKYRDGFLFTRDAVGLAASAVSIVASALTIVILARGL